MMIGDRRRLRRDPLKYVEDLHRGSATEVIRLPGGDWCLGEGDLAQALLRGQEFHPDMSEFSGDMLPTRAVQVEVGRAVREVLRARLADYRSALTSAVAGLPAASRWPPATGNRLVYRCLAHLLLHPGTSAATRRWADRAADAGVVFRTQRVWQRARAELPRAKLIDALTREVAHRRSHRVAEPRDVLDAILCACPDQLVDRTVAKVHLTMGCVKRPRHTGGTPVSRLENMGENRGGNYTKHTTGNWRIRLVGAVAVIGPGGTWEAPHVGSRKARTLLAILAAAHDRTITVETLAEELWGTKPPQNPKANVATLVSRLRARFGPAVIDGGRRGYRLGETIRVDLAEASALITQADAALRQGRPATGLQAAENGVELIIGGPVLTDCPAAEWAERARTMQSNLLRRGRHVAAECALRAGNPMRAQIHAETAVALDPLDEKAHGILMRALADAGEPARALLAYEKLRATLAKELGTGPIAATRELHIAILRANTLSACG